MNKNQVQAIADQLNKSMANYPKSLEPTTDEVSIAYLLTCVKELEDKIQKAKARLKADCMILTEASEFMGSCMKTINILDCDDQKKLTMVSVMHKSQRYTGFANLTPGACLTDEEIFKIVKHQVPAGSTFTPGG